MEDTKYISLFTDFDTTLFKAGKHYRIYEKLGAHRLEANGKKGVFFAVWAPNARYVSIVGSFNGWDPQAHPLQVRWDGSGIWEAFIVGVNTNELYKYHIE